METKYSQFITALVYILPVLLLAGCRNGKISEEAVALYLKAKEYYTQGDLDQAESSFREAAAVSDDFYQAEFMLGKTLYFTDKKEEAEELFTRLLRRLPEYREAELFYIRTCMESGKTGEAVRRTEKLLAFDSADPRLLYLRAQLYQLEEDLSASIDYFNKAALFGEEFARVFLDLGRIYYIFGMFEKAEDNVRKSLFLLHEENPLKTPVRKLLVKMEEEHEM